MTREELKDAFYEYCSSHKADRDFAAEHCCFEPSAGRECEYCAIDAVYEYLKEKKVI